MPTSANPIIMSWNWDEFDMGTGGNSADGCSLYDTDADGNVNTAVCVTWNSTGVLQTQAIYWCNDSKPDRCPGDTLIKDINSCFVSNSSDDPFATGDWYPKDTKAYCSISLADLGAGASYLDTCTYPSDRNTAPGDCVAINIQKANLLVIKKVVGNDTTTNWSMTVTGPTSFTDTLTDNDDTGIRPVDAGSYSIVEAGVSGTDIANYDTTWVCLKNGDPYLPATNPPGTGASITDVALAKGDLGVCTFTNTRKTGSLKITKTVSNPDGATLPATFTMDYNCGTGYTGQVPVAYPTPGFETVPGIPTGNICTVTEVAPATITDYTWGWPPTYTPASQVIATQGQTYEIVVGNSITKNRGSLQVTKTVNWNGVTPDTTKTFQICVSGTSYEPVCQDADIDGATLTWPNLLPGDYTVTETDPGALWSVTGSPQTVAVPAGGTGLATIINARLVPTIDIEKLVSVDGGTTFEDADSATGPYALVGSEVQFKFVVTNSGDTALSDVSVTDPAFTLPAACSVSSLAAGASYNCVVTATAVSGQQMNTATASGSYGGETYQDSDVAYYFGAAPALSLDKTVTSTGPYDSVGDVINYLLVATNTGNVTLHNVSISRSQAGHAHLHADPACHAGSSGHVELHRLPHGQPGRPGCRLLLQPRHGGLGRDLTSH